MFKGSGEVEVVGLELGFYWVLCLYAKSYLLFWDYDRLLNIFNVFLWDFWDLIQLFCMIFLVEIIYFNSTQNIISFELLY